MRSWPGLDFRHKLLLLIGLGLSLLLPLVVDLACYEPFRTPKSLLSSLLWAGAAALFFLRPSWDWWFVPGAAVVAASFVALLANHVEDGLWSLWPVSLALLGVMGLRQLPESGRRLLLSGVVLGGVLEAILALAFYHPEGRPAGYAALEPGEGRYQMLGTMGNPADVAVYLVLPSLLALAQVTQRRRRFWWFAAFALQAGVVVLSQTLSALAALSLGVAIFLTLRLPKGKRWQALLGFAAIVALIVTVIPPLRHRLRDGYTMVRQGGFLWVASARGAAWLSAWQMWQAHPLVGVGLGEFGAHSFRYLSRDALAQRGRVLGLETGFAEAHNEPLQYLAETGLLGLLALALGLWWAWRRSPPSPHPGIPALPTLAAAGVLACFQFPLHLAATAAQWLVVLVLFLPPLAEAPRSSRLGQWLGLGVFMAAFGLTWFQWRAWRAVEAAEALVKVLRQTPQASGGKTLAFQAYERLAVKLRVLPADERVETVAGNLAREAGFWPQTLTHFRRAITLAERPETHFNLGVTLWDLGKEGEGIRHLVRAVELNPAVLHAIHDRRLGEKLKNELSRLGYFSAYPWAEQWLSP